MSLASPGSAGLLRCVFCDRLDGRCAWRARRNGAQL